MKNKRCFWLSVLLVLALAGFFTSVYQANAAAVVPRLSTVTVQDPPGGIMIGMGTPQWVDAVVLVANAAQVYTVPAGGNYVLFSATNDFYADYGTAAAVPSTAITNGTGSELNPMLRSLGGAATVGLISPYATVVTICVYK